MKKKEMKTMENSPTAMPLTIEVTELMTAVTFVRLVTSFSLFTRRPMRSKWAPSPGNRPTIQSLIRSSGFPSSEELFSTEASRTMRVTTGMTCVTTRSSPPRMMTMTRMDRSQSGADFPLIRIFRSSRMRGCPMSETTKAAMM